MDTKLPYRPVEAFSHGGKIYPTEREALIAAIGNVLNAHASGGSMAERVYASGAELVPLLLRAVAVRSADNARQLGSGGSKE